MIQEQDIVVFQGRGDERLALGQSISYPDSIMIGRRIDVRVADCQRRITQGERAHDEKYMLGY